MGYSPGPDAGTDRMVDYLLHETRDTAPDAVIAECRHRVIDTLAAITAGHQYEGVDRLTIMAESLFAGGDHVVLDGSGRSLNEPGAVLVNSIAGNELDIDDGHRLAEGHPAVVIVPAAVAAVEATDGTVGDLVDAVIPAYELAVRAARAMHEWLGILSGSGSWGAVGAAAAVSKAKGMDPSVAADALGLAEFNAPIAPVMRSVANPASSFTKDGIGWGGFVGSMATALAARGFTGSGTVFDAIEHDGLQQPYLDSLGDRYHLLEGYYKPYPACRWIHPAIDGVAALFAQHDIPVPDIDAIRVGTHPNGAALGITRPTTPSEAEYSYPYVLAAAVRNRGQFTHADLTASARSDPETLALADRVELDIDPEAADRYPEESLARVAIDVDDSTVETELITPRGSKENRLSDGELTTKWTRLIDDRLGSGTTDTLVDDIQADDRPLRDLLTAWR